MATPTLAQTQSLFWKLITAPEGVVAGLEQLSSADRAAADSLVRGDARLSAVERLDVYADMYFYRLRDCLKVDFEAVCAVIGEAGFHNLITDYLLVHPPSHFSLRYAGRDLPEFLACHPLLAQWPFLADLATLEWAIMESFDARDAAPLDGAALATVPEARWPALRFQVTPSLRILRLGWPVHGVWRCVQRGEPVERLERVDTTLRVWRQDFRVFHRAMDTAESVALTTLAAGRSFAEVCDRIVAVDEHAGAERTLSLLGGWLRDGLLVGYELVEA